MICFSITNTFSALPSFKIEKKNLAYSKFSSNLDKNLHTTLTYYTYTVCELSLRCMKKERECFRNILCISYREYFILCILSFELRQHVNDSSGEAGCEAGGEALD